MKKTFELGKIQLNNDTVRESLVPVEKSMAEGNFISIEEVSVNTLLAVDGNEKALQGINSIALTVLADPEILKVSKQSDIQRSFEIVNHVFFFELFKRLERNSKKVFILGEKAEQVDNFAGDVAEQFPKLQLVGTGNLEAYAGNDDSLVNAINSLAPDAIVSLLPSPLQEVFFLEHKDKLSTLLWYGMGEINPKKKKSGLFAKLRSFRRRIALERHLHGKV